MSEETILTVSSNCDGSWQVAAEDSSGVAVAFNGGDSLECVVWQGSDSAALFSPSVSWLSAALGTITVSVSAAQTAPLTPGLYPLEVTAIPVSTGQRLRVLDAWFSVDPSPGVRAMPPVYGSYQDMVDHGGGDWLDALRKESGLSNFTRERARARSYLDRMVMKKFRPWTSRVGNYASAGVGLNLVGPPDAQNVIIRDYLAAGALMVTDDIVEIVSLKALELVCRQRLTFEAGDKWAGRATLYQALCRKLVLCTVAQLDINADGLPDYAFPLTTISIR